MNLSASQRDDYLRDGFVFIQNVLSESEVETIKLRLQNEFVKPGPSRILEKDGITVRSVYGSHHSDPYFEQLSKDIRLVGPAQRLVDDDVYIHQFKVNMKPAFSGDVWSWHQDFIFWAREDGIPEPNLTTVALFLDEVNEFNGPLALIPGSHTQGVIDVSPKSNGGGGEGASPWWVSDLTADLKFEVPRHMVAELALRRRPIAPKGPAGSLLFFHPNVVHGSASNISPYDRAVLLVTYNSVANLPTGLPTVRPDFLCGRDFAPMQPPYVAIAPF